MDMRSFLLVAFLLVLSSCGERGEVVYKSHLGLNYEDNLPDGICMYKYLTAVDAIPFTDSCSCYVIGDNVFKPK